MRRLVRTSQGWIEFRLEPIAFSGVSVRALTFGERGGWASAEEYWNSNYTAGKPLDRFLADVADLPHDEAARIAGETLDAWQRRAGSAERADERKLVRRVAGIYGFAAWGAVVLVSIVVILLVVLFVKLL